MHGRPIILYTPSGRRGAEVVTCSQSAAERGVTPGMPLAEATALWERTAGGHTARCALRTLHCALYDPDADRAALRTLAGWCRQFSPVVGVEEEEPPESLLLDVTGCAHLFGGEPGMAEQVVHAFARWGFSVRVALADTIGAAWAVARFGETENGRPQKENRAGFSASAKNRARAPFVDSPIQIVPAGRQSAALPSLPVEALRLPDRVIRTLHELEIRHISRLQRLPRSSLPSRFGSSVVRRLDQALGAISEPIVPERLPEPIEADWSAEEPIDEQRTIATVLRRLVRRIVEDLQPRREGVLCLLCRLESSRRKSIRFSIGLVRPCDSLRHLHELIRLKLERVALGGSVLRIHVTAVATAPMECRQQEIFDTESHRDREKQAGVLLNRLSNRLGCRSVLRPRRHPDAQPEYAVKYGPVVKNSETGIPEPPTKKKSRANDPNSLFPDSLLPDSDSRLLTSSFSFHRPLILHSQPVCVSVMSVFPEGPPIRFCFRNREYTIVHNWGPERIETGWWRDGSIRRDYYRVETQSGRRFWLFRQIDDGKWFFHGSFE